MTPRVARQILDYRSARGGFATIFDLADVPRVGRKTFRRITGMAYSRTGRHREEKLTRLLRLRGPGRLTLPDIVRAVAAMPDVAGCVLGDNEGLLLAASGAEEDSQKFSAIMPRLLAGVRSDLEAIEWPAPRSVSLMVDTRTITLTASGGIYLMVLQDSTRLTSRLLNLSRGVAIELAWLLSRRGYVPETPESAGGGHA